MRNNLLKIFGPTTKKIPDTIIHELLQQFPDAINIEWDMKNEFYEAVFYVNETEHIAKIALDSGLTGYKKNLKLDELPVLIAAECQKTGEIMNAIAIYTKKSILYEVIVRDNNLSRYLLLLTKTGELLESTKI